MDLEEVFDNVSENLSVHELCFKTDRIQHVEYNQKI